MTARWRKAAARRFKWLWRYLLVVVAVYAGALALGETLTAMRANFQNVVFDQYQRWRPRARSAEGLVRIVDIDDESIRRLGQWPWPRAEMAKLVDALAGAKVALIGFDVLFSETDRAPSDAALVRHGIGSDANVAVRREGDEAFAQAIADRPVVLSELVTQSKLAAVRPVKRGFTFIGENPTADLPQMSGALGPLADLATWASGIGFVNWQADADRVVRRVPLLIVVDGQIQPSFAIECLRVAQGLDLSRQVRRRRRRGGDQGRRSRRADPAGRRHSRLFRRDRSQPVDSGVEAARARRRSLRARRQDRRRRRQRVAVVGRRRDAAQPVDAGRRGASAIDRADP
jgi:adenylate cyclase